MRDKDKGEDKRKEHVYVLSNPSMPGLLKIGKTTRPVEVRVKELNRATGVPEPFKVEAVFKTKNCHKLEKFIHDKLKQYRHNNNREFFKCSLVVVLELYNKHYKSPANTNTPKQREIREGRESRVIPREEHSTHQTWTLGSGPKTAKDYTDWLPPPRPSKPSNTPPPDKVYKEMDYKVYKEKIIIPSPSVRPSVKPTVRKQEQVFKPKPESKPEPTYKATNEELWKKVNEEERKTKFSDKVLYFAGKSLALFLAFVVVGGLVEEALLYFGFTYEEYDKYLSILMLGGWGLSVLLYFCYTILTALKGAYNKWRFK